MNAARLALPEPILQIDFSERLVRARVDFLQEALLRTVTHCDVHKLDEEAHTCVPAPALQLLAGRGLRAELAFALPSLLQKNPRLLAYYRLVLGFSQKQFYDRASGLSGYRRAEDNHGFSDAQLATLPELCSVLNRAAASLLFGIRDSLSADHLKDLSLLTFGPQLRGSRNVALGTAAISQVFEVIRDIVGTSATNVEEKRIVLTDSTGRTVEIRFGSDPDIEVVSVRRPTRREAPLLAIEVKGGTDLSNAHNRLGEAEKSHLKAKKRGFTDLWTIVNVQGLSAGARKLASPTTTAFLDLADVVARQGRAYANFRERLLQRLRLPES